MYEFKVLTCSFKLSWPHLRFVNEEMDEKKYGYGTTLPIIKPRRELNLMQFKWKQLIQNR